MKILVIGKPTYNIVLTQDKYLVEGSKNLLKEKNICIIQINRCICIV